MQDFTVHTLLSGSRAKNNITTRSQRETIGKDPQASLIIPHFQQTIKPSTWITISINLNNMLRGLKGLTFFLRELRMYQLKDLQKILSKMCIFSHLKVKAISPNLVQYAYQNVQVRQYDHYPPQNQQIIHSPSRRGLFTNADISKIIQDEIQEWVASKKIDVGKVKFDRKISKLLS